MPVECLWDDKKPSFCSIFGQSFSLHLFVFIVLVHWVGCFASWYPAWFVSLLYIVGLYISYFSVHAFSVLIYWKYKKNRHFALLGIFFFWVFTISLVNIVKDFIFTSELQSWNWKLHCFYKHIIHWKVKVRNFHYFHIYFSCRFITPWVSSPYLFE